MSADRHQRLQEVFLAALELSGERRRSFLVERCGDDATLIEEVEELLEADGGCAEPARSLPDLVQGGSAYRVIEELGRGGMGVVYLAERADGAFRRRVAIKVLARRLGDDDELEQRFRAERQILAALDHPFIARLLDGGKLPDGAPFLVMEHVDGEPIDRFAARRQLSVEGRLQLFLSVCQAVQAAHQSLIVHRDLKPGNVLVTGDGTPKLLDFGIAKLLDPAAADWTVAETRLGSQPLTPRYASPEQLAGGPITTATDVYALGVLLYELLTGRSPYRPRSSAVHHWVAAVCEEEPLRPSTAVVGPPEEGRAGPAGPARELGRRLAGDLDHIVLTALRKEPERRYPTAAELAADVRRHLDGLPIVARPATAGYRAGKFLRRHRWGVAAAVLLVFLAGGFTMGLVRQLARTEVERDKARAVADVLVEVLSGAGPGTPADREPAVGDLLDRGLDRVEAQLGDQPEVAAAVLDAVGRVNNNLGRIDQAAAAHESALALRGAGAARPLERAESLSNLAVVLLAKGELGRAEELYREALAITEGELGSADPRTIACLDGLQQVLAKAGRQQEAVAVGERVVRSTLKRLGFRDAGEALASRSTSAEIVTLATTLATLAAGERRLGRYGDAENHLEVAIALARRSLGEGHYAVAFGLNNLANVLSNLERHDAAVATRAEALALAEAALGAGHPAVSSIRLNQGHDLGRLGRLEEARRAIAEARDALAAALGGEHPALATAVSYDGQVLLALGRVEEAHERQREALASLLASLGSEHPDVAEVRAALGDALSALGRQGEAAEQLGLAAALYERAFGPEHPETLDCRSRQGEALLADGRQGEARELLEVAVRGFEGRPELPLHLARARYRLARALTPEGPAGESARRLAEQAAAAFEHHGRTEAAAEVARWLGAHPGAPAPPPERRSGGSLPPRS